MKRFLKFEPIFTTLLIILIAGISCSDNNNTIETEYIQEVDKWHEKRIAALKEKDSWLSLAGLFKIKEGTQTMGADSTNDIVFPTQAPAHIGTITKKGNTIRIKVLPDVSVTHENEKVSDITMKFGTQGSNTVLRYDKLLWYVIERRGNHYIRLKDTDHPNLRSFKGIERYPVSKKWRIKSTFKAFGEPESITVPDVLNEGMQDSLYGLLEFTLEGQEYRIAPLGNPDEDEEFFIIFGDKTNGKSTYSGGRYIYIPTPDENGITYIDFNKAYNPPCVFTHFATCPLPPPQNRLPVKVTAGEKMYN